MVRNYIIVLLVGLLAASCAQVGIISGGPQDRFAPKPIAEDVVPLNETTHFTGNSVEIPFDEYFQLVNPTQNIRMVPPHAKIEASVKNKTLTLTWKDTLESNTTYAIYLNNAVKDLNQGNDTIIQYVFSTGTVLDTLSYSVMVIDAWSGLPIDDCVVALYELNSTKLISLAQPSNGIAKLNYLRKGEYRAIAFVDENNDLKLQNYEKVGFPNGGKISVDSTFFDSIPLRVFTPPSKKTGFNTITANAPCMHLLTTHQKVRDSNPKFYMNGDIISVSKMMWRSQDSVEINTGVITEGSVEYVMQYTFDDSIVSDTLIYRIRPADRDKKIKIKKGSLTIKPSSNVVFEVNGIIQSVDTSKIHLLNMSDSSAISVTTGFSNWSCFMLGFDRENIKNVKFTMDEGAVITECGTSEKFEQIRSFEPESTFGELNINVSKYSRALIVQLLKRGNLIKEITVENPQEMVSFKELWTGEYTFRVIRDSNGNGKWDVGDYATLTQPEQVDMYTKKIKVRAGWTIDIPLTPKN
ncbi:MAG: Ig-like domain-containing protein [Crocinitomicaceae bacterium]|nr:Ig-like domain-containing protein [Crocinitomicaceae bacterium]